jgi:HTH-type transcriptional regulator/antitoxin HipB
MTQTDVANRTNLRQATISNVERGDPGTQLKTLFDVLVALNLELVVRERSKPSSTSLENLFG